MLIMSILQMYAKDFINPKKKLSNKNGPVN